MPLTMYIIRYIALENNTLHKFNHLHPRKAILYIYGAIPVLQTLRGKENSLSLRASELFGLTAYSICFLTVLKVYCFFLIFNSSVLKCSANQIFLNRNNKTIMHSYSDDQVYLIR